jgi:GT2 family glycosyltransferase
MVRLDVCLGLLERQSLPRDAFEIIVADNGTPEFDALRTVVGDRARLVVAQERGAGPARNHGVAAAKGRLLAFIDSDCQPEPDWLASGIAALSRYDFVGGRVKVLVEDAEHVTATEAFEQVFAFDFKTYIERKGFTGSGNLFCPRDVFQRVGGFRTGVSEDVEWSHRARAAGFRLGYAPKAVVGHPARRTWAELLGKWRRLNAEMHQLSVARPWGAPAWLLKSCLLPLSAVVHTPRVIFSRRLDGVGQRLGALQVLYRLRLWRCADALRLLARPSKPVAESGAAGGAAHRQTPPPVRAEQARQSAALEFDVPVVIVSYARADEVVACVRSLRRIEPGPKLAIFIAENGGAAAFDRLARALASETGIDVVPLSADLPSPPCARMATFAITREDGAPGPGIHLAEMPENLGYGGGVNAWLRPLLRLERWQGAWILNPDAEPEADALTELVSYAAREGKGLVGSRLLPKADRTLAQTRGLLSWSRVRSTVVAVNNRGGAPADPVASSIDDRLDAPCGASLYATRRLIDSIGLMREHYFLYFEDLEWGVRAKRHGHAVGYAEASVVLHPGGSTIGSALRRRDRSRLAVYLDLRNKLLFVREHHPLWLPWALLVGLAEIAAFACVGSAPNVAAAFGGFFAGVLGETGRPSAFARLVRS